MSRKNNHLARAISGRCDALTSLRKLIMVVPTHDTDRLALDSLFSMHQFTAFRAFLSYLHTGLLPIAALPSDYLVARDIAHEKHIAAMPDQTGTRDAPPPEAFTFPPRGEWLRNRFHELRGQPDWKGMEPCSTHALHRVADALGCAEVEDIAISRIARSLSTANVSSHVSEFCPC